MDMKIAKTNYTMMNDWFNKNGIQERIHFEVEKLKEIINVMDQTSSESTEVRFNKTNRYAVDLESSNHVLYLRSENIPIRTLEIVLIEVSPNGHGIGTKILDSIKNYAKVNGFDRIVLVDIESEAGMKFAKKNGFSICYNPMSEHYPNLFKSPDKGSYEMMLSYNYNEIIVLRIADLCKQYNTTIYGISNKIREKYNFHFQSTLNEIMQKRTKDPRINTIHYITEALGIRIAEFFKDWKFQYAQKKD